MERKLVDVIVLRKIQKDADVWPMSARWWKKLQRKMPYDNRINSSCNSARHGQDRVLLTMLGGGVFCNETRWIADGMKRALMRYAY